MAAVLICLFCFSYRFRVKPVEMLPVFVCALVLILYVLAMLRHLSWIDGIAAAVLIVFGGWMLSAGKEKRNAFGKACLENALHPSFIAAVLLLFLAVLSSMGKVVTWWDDINFWATDVKALYFLDGFAGRYGNVAPEFGDYPPGAQLMKWWFLHLNPGEFREGYAFAGYYVMNLAFLMPLLKNLKGRNILVMVLAGAALWMFPSIAEVYGYDGFCADLTMACIYGGFLYAVTDREDKPAAFYYGRLALYMGILVLVKSIGFVWALFGLLFFFLYQWCEWQKMHTVHEGAAISRHEKLRRWRSALLVAAAPLCTGGTWMVFCLLMRRVTKTTATAVKYMTTDEYGISGYTKEFAGAFLEAFVRSPLHKEKSAVLNLTPLGLYVCICLLVILFYRFHMLPKKNGRIVLWFSMISGALFYGIIFIAHITIFATETQYLEASGMISSIERYGAPFTVGTLLFLSGIWLEQGGRFFEHDKIPCVMKKYGTYLCFILFVALTAGYQVGYHGFIGYRQETQAHLAQRAGMIGTDEEKFLDVAETLGKEESRRVCYIRRGDTPRWVNNSYMNYEASPVSVVYRSVNLDDAPADWMVEEIRSSHAGYLYVEETDADVGAVFDAITQENEFTCGVLYRIWDDGMDMKLTPMSITPDL